jgi:putative ABC transport system permease protein
VIGVTRDIYTSSLRNDIEPIVFICDENPSRAYTLGYMLVRIDAANKEETLKKICEIWSSFDKVHPPEYKFLEDNLAKQYDNEQHINELFQYLSLLTIVIACLGLLGLVSFSVSQRVKEIGIRKVLGASVVSVTALLSKDFLKLVGIAFVIAAPIGWFAMHKWLQDFAFRISVPWWVFLLSGIIAFAIALVTISVQAIRAALANPVKSLRTE